MVKIELIDPTKFNEMNGKEQCLTLSKNVATALSLIPEEAKKRHFAQSWNPIKRSFSGLLSRLDLSVDARVHLTDTGIMLEGNYPTLVTFEQDHFKLESLGRERFMHFRYVNKDDDSYGLWIDLLENPSDEETEATRLQDGKIIFPIRHAKPYVVNIGLYENQQPIHQSNKSFIYSLTNLVLDVEEGILKSEATQR